MQLAAGRYLSWLASQGHRIETAADLALASAPEKLAAFSAAEQLRGVKLTTLATALGNVMGFLRSTCGEAWDATAAWKVVDRVRRRARQLPRMHRSIADPDSLYEAGLSLMERALDTDGWVVDPHAWQDGLMLSLLTAVPIRIGNFATLRLGEHLHGGNGDTWRILLAGSETKTRREDAWDVPGSLAPYLDYFIAVVRPMLLRPASTGREAHDRLWVGAFGQPLEHQAVRQRIKTVTTMRLGRAILPHSFRHSVATAFALRNPDRPRDAASLLGHASPGTTEQHYIKSERQLARTKFQNMIEARLRRGVDSGKKTEEG